MATQIIYRNRTFFTCMQKFANEYETQYWKCVLQGLGINTVQGRTSRVQEYLYITKENLAICMKSYLKLKEKTLRMRPASWDDVCLKG